MVEGRGGRYQFAATMGLLLMLMRLDLVFWRMRGREDLFFFFWSGRAMFWRGLGAAIIGNIVREKGLGILKIGLIWINLGERCAAIIPGLEPGPPTLCLRNY